MVYYASLIVMQGEAMYSKEAQREKNDLRQENSAKELSLEERTINAISQIGNLSFFTTGALANLSVTSKTLDSMVFSELEQREAQKLVTHVVRGKQDEAEAMIKTNPWLLLIKSKAVDYSGRTIVGTAFQFAIGAGDKPM